MRAITPMRFGLVLAALGAATVFGPAPGAMAQESDEAREEAEAELDEQIETRVRLQFLKMELEVRKGQIARLIGGIADAEVRQVLDGIDGQPPNVLSVTAHEPAATPARPAEEEDDDDEDDTQARIDRARETLERMKADYVEKLKEAARLGLKLEAEEMEEIEIEVQAGDDDEHSEDVRRVVGQIGRVLETLLKAAEEIQHDVDDD